MKAIIFYCLLVAVFAAEDKKNATKVVQKTRKVRNAGYPADSYSASYAAHVSYSPSSNYVPDPAPLTVYHAPAPTMTTYIINTHHSPPPKPVYVASKYIPTYAAPANPSAYLAAYPPAYPPVYPPAYPAAYPAAYPPAYTPAYPPAYPPAAAYPKY